MGEGLLSKIYIVFIHIFKETEHWGSQFFDLKKVLSFFITYYTNEEKPSHIKYPQYR